MITRRQFVQLGASALPALALRSANASAHIPIGLEMYTVRRQAAKDLPSTLKQVRAIGYELVEISPLSYKYSAQELRKIIADSGLTAPSGGFDYDKFPSSFDFARKLGLEWMLLGALPDAEGSTADGVKRGAANLNQWGKQARKMGMKVAFHTHDDVFRSYNGVTQLDILRKETDPELVFFEVDCYWVTQAGRDPVQILNQLGKRVRMVHLKDRKPGFPFSTDTGESSQHFTEVGSGTIRWRQVLAAAQKLGVEHYFVEQDETKIPVMQSIAISYNYLRKILP